MSQILDIVGARTTRGGWTDLAPRQDTAASRQNGKAFGGCQHLIRLLKGNSAVTISADRTVCMSFCLSTCLSAYIAPSLTVTLINIILLLFDGQKKGGLVWLPHGQKSVSLVTSPVLGLAVDKSVLSHTFFNANAGI